MNSAKETVKIDVNKRTVILKFNVRLFVRKFSQYTGKYPDFFRA